MTSKESAKVKQSNKAAKFLSRPNIHLHDLKKCPELKDVFNTKTYTKEVLEQTIRKAKKAGLRYSFLDTLWDVDRPDDLLRLSELEPVFEWVK